MTLPASEFIRRFLQHVLPRGTHKVRYYGIWNPAYRALLRRVQLVTGPLQMTGAGYGTRVNNLLMARSLSY